MHRSSNKFLAAFLAILLVMAPLQGVMAGVTASSGADELSHSMMRMADSGQMVAMNEATGGSEPCEQAECCNGEGCAVGHCVTCVAGVHVQVNFFSNSVFLSSDTDLAQAQ